MFASGLFLGGGATYFLNAALEVAIDYSSASERTIGRGDYGSLDPRGRKTFQGVKPGATVGYAF